MILRGVFGELAYSALALAFPRLLLLFRFSLYVAKCGFFAMEALRLTGFYIPASVNLAAHLALPDGRQLGKGPGTRMGQFAKRPRVGKIAGLVGGRYSFFLLPYYFFFTAFSRALAGAHSGM